MSEKVYVGVILADIHWGVMNPMELYLQLKKHIIEHMKKLSIIDFIVIAGDYFDTKISMNSEHAKYSLKFMSEILEIAIEKKTRVRIIKGTESHDNKQLEILNIFSTNDKFDFKIISTVEKENLFDDMKVLYIPEEYMDDKNEYYKEYFNDEYDMIFGHGLINEVAFVATKQESEITMAKAPIFKSEQLMKICKGPIFFGHIHTPQVIEDKFFYVGSTSRWSYGEEEEKGFYMVSYSPTNSGFMTEFILNKSAKKYDTITIDFGEERSQNTDCENIDLIMSFVKSISYDNLRLIVNIPETYTNPILLSNMINEVFSKYPNMKVVINNNSKLIKKQETDKKINMLLDKFGFIFDKSNSYEEKITQFIKIKYNRNIPIERLREYLYQKILEEVNPL